MENNKASKKDVIITELNKILGSASEEERERLLYVLDYILNYFTGERRVPKLKELGFSSEVSQLKNIGVVEEKELYWRGHPYKRLLIRENLVSEVRRILQEKYYPLFDENTAVEILSEIIRDSLSVAVKLWNEMLEFDTIQYTLSEKEESGGPLVEFGKKLAQNEFGFYIGYYTASWGSYCDQFVFRTKPFDIKKIFMDIVSEEFEESLRSSTPAERWCIYLRSLKPKASKEFILNNIGTRFLPCEIKNALEKIPCTSGYPKGIRETVIEEEKKRILRTLKIFARRDPQTAHTLSTLLLISEIKESCYFVNKDTLDKLKEEFTPVFEQINSYTKYFHSLGLIFKQMEGDLIIPIILEDALNELIKGDFTDFKIFEEEMDAEAFVEDEISRAEHEVKIWDPYVKGKILTLLKRAINRESVKIEILSSLPGIEESVKQLQQTGIKVEAKIIYKNKMRSESPFHDRYLIIDNHKVWHFGPSLKDVGRKKWESAALFPKEIGKVFVDGFHYNFNKSKEEWEKEGYKFRKVGD